MSDRFGPLVTLDNPAFIHPSAQIYGRVTLQEGVSMWPNTVIRAEMHEVVVGANTNLQDFVMVHVGDRTPTLIGANCSITHHCTIHGCTIGNNVLVGIDATIMDGCVIGDNSVIAGGSFLKEGTVIPPNSIVMGIPGKVTKTRNSQVKNQLNAWMYRVNAEAYARGEHRAWAGETFESEAMLKYTELQQAFARQNPDQAGARPKP